MRQKSVGSKDAADQLVKNIRRKTARLSQPITGSVFDRSQNIHAISYDEVTGATRMPVIAVQMVSGPDEARFYRRVLAVIGAPEPPRATVSVLESLVLRLLAQIRPGMLVIDEIHSLQAGSIREQARFLNMLRISLVCVGTQDARNALRTDDQLVRRFEAFALSAWKNSAEFEGLIGSLHRSLPLRRESEIDAIAMKRIITATGGITAGIFSLMGQLAIEAIESGAERIMLSEDIDTAALRTVLGEMV